MAMFLVTGCSRKDAYPVWDYGAYPENYEEIVKAGMAERLDSPGDARFVFEGRPEPMWITHAVSATEYGFGGKVTIDVRNRFGKYSGPQAYTYLIRDGHLLSCEKD